MRVTAFEVWEFSTFDCKYMIKNNLNNILLKTVREMLCCSGATER